MSSKPQGVQNSLHLSLDKSSGTSKKKILSAIFVGAIVPGMGHVLLGLPVWGMFIFLALGGSLAISFWHLLHGIGIFETAAGAFYFAILLKAVVIGYAFSVVDVYHRAIFPEDSYNVKRRQAVVLNLLVPGAGYLFAKQWIRAATSFLLIALFIYYAGIHPFLDVAFSAIQVITAFAVHKQMGAQATMTQRKLALANPMCSATAAKIPPILAIAVAVLVSGRVIQRTFPNLTLLRLSPEKVQMVKNNEGLHFSLPEIALSIDAVGPGWSKKQYPGFLFAAEHQKGAQLMMTAKLILPYMRTEHFVQTVRQWTERNSLAFQKELKTVINGNKSIQMKFASREDFYPVDHWTIVVPQKEYAVILVLSCQKPVCQELKPVLEKSRDSLKLGQGL